MKFLKASVFLLFLFSLLSAGLTLYLSTVRENEKEKRIYLEGVRDRLETENVTLKRQVAGFESEKQNLENQLDEEMTLREQAMILVQEKELNLKTLKVQAAEAEKAFQTAQKRNQELERILDELESRMRRVEGPDAVYLDVNVASKETSADSVSNEPEWAPLALATGQSADLSTPQTKLPGPPRKRRRFFPFSLFSGKNNGDSQEQEKESAEVEPITPVAIEPAEETQEPETKPLKTVILHNSEEETLPVPIQKKKAVPTPPRPQPVTPKADRTQEAGQTIAAGSVLLVNRQYNFIVVNLGSRQGARLDDILTVQKNDSPSAKARVEKLYDDYCAAYIVEEQSDREITEGDVVTLA